MFTVPFTDSTEARYAEIARLMVVTNDWITPYINFDIPFWGKPPLAFWVEALSFKIFGINEFAPRFPSMLATIATIALIFRLLNTPLNKSRAIIACLIFSSCLLAFVLSGAVLTDPFLTLAVTLSLVSFSLVQRETNSHWRYWFFIGLAIGLLAKGPIAIILIGGPIGLWLLLAVHRWKTLLLLPWFSGTLLTAALVLPWYIAAEIKTPGFIKYFIVGEHFYRFVDPGWAGDLYGVAHKQPKGTIWLQWLGASLPWGFIAIGLLIKHLSKKASRSVIYKNIKNDEISLYILWAIFPMLFFTLSGNVLWTYLLPALPGLAILLAIYFSQPENKTTDTLPRSIIVTALITPAIALGITIYAMQIPASIPTEKELIGYFDQHSNKNESLYFVGDRSFSARYYSKESAELLTLAELNKHIQSETSNSFYLAMPNNFKTSRIQQTQIDMQLVLRSKKYKLYKVQKKR